MIYGTDMGGFASGFVHKRLFRAAKGFVTSGFNPLAAAAGFVSPTSQRAEQLAVRRPAPRSQTARPSATSAAEKEAGRAAKFANGGQALAITGGGRCGFGFVRDAAGNCVRRGRDLFDPLGLFGGPAAPSAAVAAAPAGVAAQAVMGRFGAAYVPGSRIIDRAICLPGDVVAVDGLCYPRSKLRNADRAWPRGRRPLLTGGEMRAISTAARAGRRLELASKRLQKIGLMKKPPSRSKPKLITSGPSVHHHHSEH